MRRKTIRNKTGRIFLSALLSLCLTLLAANTRAQDKITPAEARKIAKEAYIFNYPLVMYYRTMYLQAIDSKSKVAKGVKRVIQGDTEFLGTLTRTQLLEPKDLPNVKKIQQKYKLQPLSSYLGKTPPKAAPAIQWRSWKDGDEKTDEFWVYVNFLLQFTTPNPQDKGGSGLERQASEGRDPG